MKKFATLLLVIPAIVVLYLILWIIGPKELE